MQDHRGCWEDEGESKRIEIDAPEREREITEKVVEQAELRDKLKITDREEGNEFIPCHSIIMLKKKKKRMKIKKLNK